MIKIRPQFIYITITILVVSSSLWMSINYRKQVDATVKAFEDENKRLQKTLFLLTNNIALLHDENMKKDYPLSKDVVLLRTEVQILREKIDRISEEYFKSTKKSKLGFYLEKLRDKDFTNTYGECYTWYIAAEKIGEIGRPAIPFLIDKLDTKDSYERTQILYALFLAANNENVKNIIKSDIPELAKQYTLPPLQWHKELVAEWKSWWKEYKNILDNHEND